MKRWLRRIWLMVYHTASFLWFAVAIIVVFFWIRSYWIADHIGFGSRVIFAAPDSPDGKIWLGGIDWESNRGSLAIRAYRQREALREVTSSPRSREGPRVQSELLEGDWSYLRFASMIEKENAAWSLLGFAYGSNDETPELYNPENLFSLNKTNHWALWIPYWAITPIVALWPLIWLCLLARSIRNLKRMARGHCGKCNYNLRGSITENAWPDACPECGVAQSR